MTARAELGDRHHARFDMHVGVAQARHEIAAAGIDDLGLCRRCSAAASGPTIGKAPLGHGDVDRRR